MVERFNPNWNPACAQGMHKVENGDFVHYSDYTALKRQIAELRVERDNFAVTVVNLANQRDAAEADKARLSEALTEIATRNRSRDQLQEMARAALSGSGAAHPVQPGWRDMESAPKDKTPVIIAVPTKDLDGYTIGEAYFDPENYEGGDWWWAGTDYSDYYAGPISEVNHHPPKWWQPLPAAPQPKGD